MNLSCSLRKVFASELGDVTVVDVSARDGLQSLPIALPPERRAAWVRALLAAGVPEVEAASFVSPARVPQMAGAAELLSALSDEVERLWVLVPNRRGAEEALAAGARNVVCVLSATESHSRANLGRPVATVLAEVAETVRALHAAGARARAAVSMAWVDPDEGEVSADRVIDLGRSLHEMGFRELTLCDTHGGASPRAVAGLVEELTPLFAPTSIGLHLHDTFGMAAASALAGLLAGVRRFDGSLAGLGGCPFAPGAAGNLDTELLVRLLHGVGAQTGISPHSLREARATCLAMLQRES